MNVIDYYDFKSQQWFKRQCTGDIPSMRSSMQSVKISGSQNVFFFGGYYIEEFYNDCFVLDLNLFEWTKLSVELSIISKRAYFSMNFDGENIFVFGGRGKSKIFDSLYKIMYDVKSGIVLAESVAAIGDKPSERFGHAAAFNDRSM